MITTEFQPTKVARARENLLAGGLADLIGLREGDALHTLAHDLPDYARRGIDMGALVDQGTHVVELLDGLTVGEFGGRSERQW